MKNLFELKVAVSALLVICILCAAAAFLIPTTHGAVFSYAAMGAAGIIAVLCLIGMFLLYFSL